MRWGWGWGGGGEAQCDASHWPPVLLSIELSHPGVPLFTRLLPSPISSLTHSPCVRSIAEVTRDANRISLMRAALQSRKRYLVAAGGDAAMAEAGGDDDDEEGEDAGDDTWGDAPAPAPAEGGKTAKADADAEHGDEAWSDSGHGGGSRRSSRAASMDAAPGTVTVDALGALPDGWTVQSDEEGDRWYFHEASGQTSWVRPNPDGSIPPAE